MVNLAAKSHWCCKKKFYPNFSCFYSCATFQFIFQEQWIAIFKKNCCVMLLTWFPNFSVLLFYLNKIWVSPQGLESIYQLPRPCSVARPLCRLESILPYCDCLESGDEGGKDYELMHISGYSLRVIWVRKKVRRKMGSDAMWGVTTGPLLYAEAPMDICLVTWKLPWTAHWEGKGKQTY